MRRFLRNTYLGFFGSFRKPSPGVHIINSHFVSPDIPSDDDLIKMDDYLSFLSQNCKLITIQEATQIILSGNISQNICQVAFTFDDGFEECHSVIAPTLEKHGCNAAFFINSNYIESDESYQDKFNRRINTYTKKPMTWDQVIDLHNRGHVIGAHTLDHLNLADLSDLEIENQLVLNKNILENKLHYQCNYFAWTYGQFQHFPERALKITQNYHKFIFSGTDYKNYYSYDGAVINRRHLEAFWPKNHIRFFLSVKKLIH